MSLFKSELTYKGIVDYLVALSDQEYKKITKVVNIRRKSNNDVSDLLGCTLADYKLEYEDIGKPPIGVKLTLSKGKKK